MDWVHFLQAHVAKSGPSYKKRTGSTFCSMGPVFAALSLQKVDPRTNICRKKWTPGPFLGRTTFVLTIHACGKVLNVVAGVKYEQKSYIRSYYVHYAKLLLGFHENGYSQNANFW